MSSKYDDLSCEELAKLLQARDKRDATRFGLVWEANEIHPWNLRQHSGSELGGARFSLRMVFRPLR